MLGNKIMAVIILLLVIALIVLVVIPQGISQISSSSPSGSSEDASGSSGSGYSNSGGSKNVNSKDRAIASERRHVPDVPNNSGLGVSHVQTVRTGAIPHTLRPRFQDPYTLPEHKSREVRSVLEEHVKSTKYQRARDRQGAPPRTTRDIVTRMAGRR